MMETGCRYLDQPRAPVHLELPGDVLLRLDQRQVVEKKQRM